MKKAVVFMLAAAMLLSLPFSATSADTQADEPYEIADETDTSVSSASAVLLETDFEENGFNGAFNAGGVSGSAALKLAFATEIDNTYYSVTYTAAGTQTAQHHLYSTVGELDSYIFSGDIRWETRNTSGFTAFILTPVQARTP